VDYVIISSHMYGRYYKNRMLNEETVIAYENLPSMGVLIISPMPTPASRMP